MINADCRINSLSLILKYNGIDLNPSVCFGLSESLGFYYWTERVKRMPYLALLGRKININYCEKEIDDIITIDKLIDNNIPVVVSVDKFYLDYLESIGQNNSHMGLHSVVCIGKDNNNYLLIDGLLNNKKPIEMNEKNFNLARSSEWKPFPPKGHIYYIESCERYDKNNISETCYNSIKNTVYRLLYENEIDNLLNFRKELFELFEKLDLKNRTIERYSLMQLKVLYSLMFEMESTSSSYRGLYFNFLQIYSNKTSNKGLSKLVRIEGELVLKEWYAFKAIIEQVLTSKNILGNYNYIIDKLQHIYESEARFFESLSKIII